MLCVEFRTNLFWTCEQLYRCILGLGSRLCQTMRDEYPMSMNHLMSYTVAPSGESPLQNYNALYIILGLGSRLCETMRDEYPMSMNHLMSCTVTPCVTGESLLQNYNALYMYFRSGFSSV